MIRPGRLQQVSTNQVQPNGRARIPAEIPLVGRDDAGPTEFEVLADPSGTRFESDEPIDPPRPSWWKRHRKWLSLAVILALFLAVGLYFGLPYIREALNTVSTDDAFVEGHVTYVSPRVEGVVTEVFVDQTNRVEPGTVLLRLDRAPFELDVAAKQAALREARAELVQARTMVQARIAGARASYYKRQTAQEELRRQIAALHAQVADLKSAQSSYDLAKIDQRRIENLVRRGSATQAELDDRNNRLKVAEENVTAAQAAIQEARAALGLVRNETNPLEIPTDLETRQSSVQAVVSDIVASLSQVGIRIDPNDAAQSRSFREFLKPNGDVSPGEGLEPVIAKAPAVQVAKAAVQQAETALDDAELKLSYTEIRSEVAGFVQDRSVHPGDHVAPGRTLLSIRPEHVWITANFKETQLDELAIGQPVDLEVDAYPHTVFHGRIAGFRPGTGLSESLLPPENATGNYVKVTQRLGVRIELTQPNPPETPLFVGLSVVPRVRYKERPTGPGAGRRLHSITMRAPPDLARGPASRSTREKLNATGEQP